MYRLLCLHDSAKQFGGGLKPNLYELLIKGRVPETETVRNLSAYQKSAGPAHHDLSPEELQVRGVRTIDGDAKPNNTKDGTDG